MDFWHLVLAVTIGMTLSGLILDAFHFMISLALTWRAEKRHRRRIERGEVSPEEGLANLQGLYTIIDPSVLGIGFPPEYSYQQSNPGSGQVNTKSGTGEETSSHGQYL